MADQDDAQGGFFTGLSNRNGTKPGLAVMNETFLVRFEGIQTEKLNPTQWRFVKDRFESSYDWEQMMEMILECLDYFYDEGDFQIDCQTSIKAWLSEFEGWGLMFTLLPMDFQKFLLVLFAHMNVKNSQENVVKSNRELFEELQEHYERETQGLPLSDLVPKVEARLLNIIGGPRVCERRKMLKVKFLSQRYTLIANFTVEKKRLRRSLVEHAAEVVARMVDDTEELEIPETLKQVVNDKIIERSVEFAKYKAGEEKEGIKLDGVKEGHDKTVHQVVPVSDFPMTKWLLENIFRKPLIFIQRSFGRFFSFSFCSMILRFFRLR